MANNFKELNSLNIKRPAVVTIKKPFATDAEMAHELRSLLFKVAPQSRKSITRIVGTGKLKAVYFQPYIPGTPYILDDYVNLPYFDPVKTNYGLNLEEISVSAKSDKEYFSNVCSSLGGGGDMSLSRPEVAANIRASEWIPKKYLSSSNEGDFEGTFQTYFCWVFDPDWVIDECTPETTKRPDVVKSVKLIKYIPTGIDKSTLNKHVFSETKIGKKLLKYNNVYRMYKIEVTPGIGHMKLMSEKDLSLIKDTVEKKYGKESFIDYSQAINLNNKLTSFYSSHLNDLLSTAESQYKYTLGVRVDNLLPNGTENPINSLYNPSKTYTIQGKSYTWVNGKKVYNPISSYGSGNISVRYTNAEDGAKLILTSHEFVEFPYSKIIDAFIFFYKDFISIVSKPVSYIDALDQLKRWVPLYNPKLGVTSGIVTESVYINTTPFRYELSSGTTIRGYFTPESRYIFPGSVIAYYSASFNRAKAYQTVTESKTVVSRQKNVPTTILDFKYTWYKNIFEKYIYPRYSRVKQCQNVFIKECTENFVEDLIRLGIRGESGKKTEIVEMCDRTLFNLYTGFYILSETYLDETISNYVNTEIYPEYISEDIEKVQTSISEGINSISNRDIESVVVSRQVMGKSTCLITIKNNKKKYNINNDAENYGGEVVFEPLDEVMVFFPSTNNELILSFRGYISSVEESVVEGYHKIGVSCDCPIKRLEMVRTNIKPSLSSEEAEDNIIHPFTVPEQMYDSFENWGIFMLLQGLSFLHSMLPTDNPKSYSNKIFTLNKDESPKFYDDLLTYLWYKVSQDIKDQKIASNALDSLIDKYTVSIKHYKDAPISDKKTIYGKIQLSKYSDLKNTLEKPYSIDYELYAQRKECIDDRTVVSQILGTRQPAMMIGCSDIPLLFSDYRTNVTILLDTAEKFNFFFYSDRSGIVQFRPPQIDATELSMVNGLIDNNIVLGKKDLSYIVHPDILSEQITNEYTCSKSDEKLVTWLPLTGEIEFGIGAEAGMACVVQNKPLSLKYGIKSQRDAVITGIRGADALYLYGLSLMDRTNKTFRTASATTLGYGDMDVNRTVYSPTDNTLYLREGLILEYRSGNTFTAKSSLNWGRKNLFKLDDFAEPIYEEKSIGISRTKPKLEWESDPSGSVIYKVNSEDLGLEAINLDGILSRFTEKFNRNEITVAYYNQIKTLINYIKNNEGSRHILSSFIFNGYVWDGVSSISFEDLMQVSYDSKIQAFADFSLATGLISNAAKDANALAELRKSFNRSISDFLMNSTGIYICVILTSNPQQAKGIWVTQRPL